MTKLTKAILREHHIFNPHNLCTAGGGKIFIGYSPQVTGRAYRSAKWQIIGSTFKTDPTGHWTDYGHKTFNPSRFANGNESHHQAKAKALEAAKLWASEKYGITHWERDPFGDWQELEVMNRVRKLVEEMSK